MSNDLERIASLDNLQGKLDDAFQLALLASQVTEDGKDKEMLGHMAELINCCLNVVVDLETRANH